METISDCHYIFLANKLLTSLSLYLFYFHWNVLDDTLNISIIIKKTECILEK